jgi:SulP family sulfate permease
MPARQRYTTILQDLPLRDLPAAALRETLRAGYKAADLKRDILAGLVVGVVALPLSMALSIAVGAPPQHGLYTAIVAGLVVALLGGSPTQVTGPTAAFIVILAPIFSKFGLGGLLVAGMMGGVMLLLMGLLRLGRLIQFIPHPVTTGFTTGIATVIATMQLKDLFGLTLSQNPDLYVEKVAAMWDARGTGSLLELAVGLSTLALLLVLPRLTKRVPAPLLALPLAALGAALLNAFLPEAKIDTIAGRFSTVLGGETIHGIPQLPPLPLWPWNAPGPDGAPLGLSFAMVRELLPGAFAIAMLGAIESLLSAVVADGLANTRHKPDAELFAQGVGNILAPFFGGIPATGAIARTATNIRSGARSPVAAAVHALTVLLAVLVLAPLIGYLPMASLAGLLLLVAYNMSDVKHFFHILRVAPKSDVVVLLVCYGLTVAFDMVLAVSVGVVLAALLFMRRMAEVTEAKIFGGEHAPLPAELPADTLVYDIAGPLFFGAAQKAMEALDIIAQQTRVVILRLGMVPAMDATGLVALESALKKLRERSCFVVITGLQSQPAQLLQKAHIETTPGILAIAATEADAVGAARDFLRSPSPNAPALSPVPSPAE